MHGNHIHALPSPSPLRSHHTSFSPSPTGETNPPTSFFDHKATNANPPTNVVATLPLNPTGTRAPGMPNLSGAHSNGSVGVGSQQQQQQQNGPHPPALRSVPSSSAIETSSLSREHSMRGAVKNMASPGGGGETSPLVGGRGGPPGLTRKIVPGSGNRQQPNGVVGNIVGSSVGEEPWGANLTRKKSNRLSGASMEGEVPHGLGIGGGVLPNGNELGGSGRHDDEFETMLLRSPLVNSLLNRIHHQESSVSTLASQLTTINTTLSNLLQSPSTSSAKSSSSAASDSGSQHADSLTSRLSSSSNAGVEDDLTSSEAFKLITSQVIALSSSVAQLQALAVSQHNFGHPLPNFDPATATSSRPGTPSVSGLPPPIGHSRDHSGSGMLTPGGSMLTPGAGTPFASSHPLGSGAGSGAFNLVLPTSKLAINTSSRGGEHSHDASLHPPPASQSNIPLSSPRNAMTSPSLLTSSTSNPSSLSQWGGSPNPNGLTTPGGSLVGQGRPPVGGRSFSSVGPSGEGGGLKARRPVGNFNRMESFEVLGGGNLDLSHSQGGWPGPAPGPTTPGGSSLGPGASHNIAKWDQVGLVPELLRGILKYGIGPPNKVQQRALPFLLRGSDIIAQAPPTQERIIAYVVPAINLCLSHQLANPYRGPQIVIITTTVDQATQASKLVRDLASPLGVRSSLCTGPVTAQSGTGAWIEEQRMLAPAVVIGTPAKISELFSGGASGRGLSGDGVRFLVIDEVDQLIARNLYEHVIEVVKRFPLPRSRTVSNTSNALMSPAVPQSPYDAGASSPFNPSSNNPFPGTGSTSSRRFPNQSHPAGAIGSPSLSSNADTSASSSGSGGVDRQTCLFSNTVPQDVLNFSNAIQVREPVRVLVRREGGGSQPQNSPQIGGMSPHQGGMGGFDGGPQTPGGGGGGGLKHLYLYLAFTAGSGGGRVVSDGGAGAIGAGRNAGGGEANQSKEWKLDALADLLDDENVLPGIIYVGGESALDAVGYKLAQRGLDPSFLHPDMSPQSRLAALQKFRSPSPAGRGKVLVVFELTVKTNESGPVRLVINYDLPRSVEGYAQRVAPAVSPSNLRPPGVVVNMIQANGGDVEMLRSIECAYKFKCSEVPVNLREAF